MSYDLRLAVKVEGGNNLYAVIDEPELSSPTYNLGKMFRACMDWDFNQGEWYKVSEVIPKIERGIHELRFSPKKYEQYNAPNGWGTINTAIASLNSLLECIERNVEGQDINWNSIPLDLLYIAW